MTKIVLGKHLEISIYLPYMGSSGPRDELQLIILLQCY